MKNYCKKILLLLCFLIAIRQAVNSQVTDTIKTGSFIINMGILPQTINNSVRPYGMVFEMVNYYKIPVKWVINPAKALYGDDFIHNSINYRGGTFVIPAEYITPAITARINTFWVTGQGVVGAYAVSNFPVNGVYLLQIMPTLTFDTDNGAIAKKYFDDAQFDIAQLPTGQSLYYAFRIPSQLDLCDNVYYMPHADPTWATHGTIRDWVINKQGYFWGSCHAMSVLESLVNPSDATQKMNFLSTNGLQCYSAGKCNLNTQVHAANPTTVAAISAITGISTHPVGQFMTDPFAATTNGSEQWFIPLTAGSGWRPTTLNFGNTKDYAVTGSQPHRGTYLTFGTAFGNNSYGKVMYLGGHAHDGTAQANIAAMRASLNFYIYAASQKANLIPVVSIAGLPDTLYGGTTFPLTANITTGIPSYTYSWSATCASAVFSSTTTATTNLYIPTLPFGTDSILCKVSVNVTDACARSKAIVKNVKIYKLFILPENNITFTGKLIAENKVQVSWDLKGYSNIDFVTVERSINNGPFEKIGLPVTNSINLNTFLDNAAANGNNTYRMAFHNSNGQVLYSKSIIIKNTNIQDNITITPNPFNDKLVVSYKDINSKNICIAICNATGMQVYKKDFVVKNTGVINISQFNIVSPGLYLLSVFNTDDGSRIVTKKLIKK
jgi:Secretion system C-terminal sorting domain